MRLIQFNVYFSHHLHISVLSYITYIIHVHTYMFGTGVAVPTLGTRTAALFLFIYFVEHTFGGS